MGIYSVGLLPLLVLLLLLCSFIHSSLSLRHFCYDARMSLSHRGQLASVILTGTVEKLNRTLRGSAPYGRALIRVKRVIKGLREVRTDRITVVGFGDPQLCDSRVGERDTKIFFLHPTSSDDSSFKLNSSLARINLRNLALLDATVAGEFWPPRVFVFVISLLTLMELRLYTRLMAISLHRLAAILALTINTCDHLAQHLKLK